MILSLISEDKTHGNMVASVIKTLSTLSVSTLLDMLEGSIRQMIMSGLPFLATMGLYARKKSITTPASVCLDPTQAL